jgi:hypothetical protein
MPTPSETSSLAGRVGRPYNKSPRRSVFGNYSTSEATCGPGDNSDRTLAGTPPLDRPPADVVVATHSASLQAGIHRAIARSFVYRYLAKAYEDPTLENWRWLTDSTTNRDAASLRLVCLEIL